MELQNQKISIDKLTLQLSNSKLIIENQLNLQKILQTVTNEQSKELTRLYQSLTVQQKEILIDKVIIFVCGVAVGIIVNSVL